MGGCCAKAKDPVGWQPVVDLRDRTSQRELRSKKSVRYHTSQIFDEDYSLENEEVLGSGYNGMVKVCVSRVTGERCAVKSFTKQVSTTRSSKSPGSDDDDPHRQLLKNECEIYLALDHPNIARLIDCYEDQFSIYFVMELCSGGELYARLIAQKQYSESDAQAAVKQMLLATNYLHHHGIVHRDLKLENFLYWAEDSDVLKMIDFGFSHVLNDKKPVVAACGSISYMAPEVIASAAAAQAVEKAASSTSSSKPIPPAAEKEDPITDKVDMWSLGVITFMLLSGYPPFSGGHETELLSKIQNAQYVMIPERWHNVSAKGRDFVEKLLVVSKTQRMTAEDALHHPWITEAIAPLSSSAGVQWGTDVLGGIREFATASHFKRACLSMMAWGLTPKERAQVRDLFYDLDREGDGFVTLDVFKEALQEHYPSVASEEIVRLFHAVDTNHSGKIYYNDFLATMLQFRLHVHESLLRHTFNQLDVGRSGKITVENLATILGKTFEGATVEEFMDEVKGDRNGEISYEDFCKYLGCDPNSSKLIVAADALRGVSREVYEEVDRKLEHQEEVVSKLYQEEESKSTVNVGGEQTAQQIKQTVSGSTWPREESKLGTAAKVAGEQQAAQLGLAHHHGPERQPSKSGLVPPPQLGPSAILAVSSRDHLSRDKISGTVMSRKSGSKNTPTKVEEVPVAFDPTKEDDTRI
ncbi:unnamed protein product [Amoebophrya sp. A120]|nr:unnamed protein product [Amoebophrya sp. A120]|eukprot:GSA120T00024035001.1